MSQIVVVLAQAGATAVGNVAHGVQATGATAANAAEAVAGRRRMLDAVVGPSYYVICILQAQG